LKALRFALLACLLWLVTMTGAGCATTSTPGDTPDTESTRRASNPDPWEPMNRGVFAFNEALDQYALEPAATAWDFVLPSFVQTGIRNVFANLNMPIVFANDLLQLKPKAAVEDVVRFVHNSVFGIAGLIDVASMSGIPENDEDFGQTLGYWGVPPGPYLMVPILGPYTLRDGVGEIIDTGAASYAYFTPFWYDVAGLNGIETVGASVGLKGLELLNLRAIYLEELEASKNDAFDYYTFVRSAYLQNRRAKVLDQTDIPANDEDDLYFDEESEDDFEDEDEDYDDY
jgi:phospholipid-binding lipoprotein MlaA